MHRIVVFGGSGYSGLELLRLLAGHPGIRLGGASSDRFTKQKISKHVPMWTGTDRFVSHDELAGAVSAGDVAFLATPNETSLKLAPLLLDRGAKVIDLSGAFRLSESQQYSDWYGFPHTRPDLLQEAVYGLPELFLDTYPKEPRLIANPGCYATAAIVALAPLLRAGLLEVGAPIVVDGKSGATGAGRKLADDLLFSEVAETVRPYRLGSHQHTPEIERFLGQVAQEPVMTLFTAHLLSVRRGLLASAYARAREGTTQAMVDAAYRDLYASATFVRVLEDRIPHPGAVVYTNFCDVKAQLDVRTGTIMAFGAIDNLVKGAAGQAVQNLNIMLGLDPTTGLLSGVSQ